MIMAVTKMFGSSFHQSAMDEACECVLESSEAQKQAEYLVWFYQTNNPEKLEEQADGTWAIKMGKGDEAVLTPVTELLESKRKKKGGIGALWWSLAKAYPDFITWVTEGENGLSADQCVVV